VRGQCKWKSFRGRSFHKCRHGKRESATRPLKNRQSFASCCISSSLHLLIGDTLRESFLVKGRYGDAKSLSASAALQVLCRSSVFDQERPTCSTAVEIMWGEVRGASAAIKQIVEKNALF